RLVAGAGQIVAHVAEVLADLVAGVPDRVGDALVAVSLAPGFLGVLLGFAIRGLRVVHVCDLRIGVATWSDSWDHRMSRDVAPERAPSATRYQPPCRVRAVVRRVRLTRSMG